MQKTRIPVILLIVAVCLLVVAGYLGYPVPLSPGARPAETTQLQPSYSFVHISDTQFLSAYHPGALTESFRYLESVKSRYNIQAVFLTGDIVDDWTSEQQWKNYITAKSLTTIPVYEIAGNHDNNGNYCDEKTGLNWTNYDRYIGPDKHMYTKALEDFEITGISWVSCNNSVLTPEENATIHSSDPAKLKIIFTHYCMDRKGAQSDLGLNILQESVTSDTLVLCGHKKGGDLIDIRNRGNYTVTMDLLDRQEIQNYLVGRLYTVSHTQGILSIEWMYIYFYPNPHIGTNVFDERTLPESSITTTQKVAYDGD
jgi:hypothetical protein